MKQVALLRGINVGGHGKLPMADLRLILEALGAEDVRTYIQSGNIVFSGTLSDEAIASAIEDHAGFRPFVIVLSGADFLAILSDNPFETAAATDPKSLHAYVGADALPPLPDTITSLATTEEIAVKGRACFLHAPGGIGRSKLAAKLDRSLNQPVTARNWRTMRAIADLLEP